MATQCTSPLVCLNTQMYPASAHPFATLVWSRHHSRHLQLSLRCQQMVRRHWCPTHRPSQRGHPTTEHLQWSYHHWQVPATSVAIRLHRYSDSTCLACYHVSHSIRSRQCRRRDSTIPRSSTRCFRSRFSRSRSNSTSSGILPTFRNRSCNTIRPHLCRTCLRTTVCRLKHTLCSADSRIRRNIHSPHHHPVFSCQAFQHCLDLVELREASRLGFQSTRRSPKCTTRQHQLSSNPLLRARQRTR